VIKSTPEECATSELPADELDRRSEEAKKRYQETIEYVTADDIAAAAKSGEAKIRKLETAIPQALRAVWSDVTLLVSMVRDYAAGAYREIPFGTIAAVAAAIIYLVSPIDAIPDVIPIIGFIDDAAVIALCMRMAHEDIKDYREWKHSQTIGHEPSNTPS
jgi:uncharacterized membrane protein YkvA (DUF1232 family)